MCELLGMSANVPTDICFSFCGLLKRGGETGPHSDGWGIAFYEGKGVRTFHDPSPSADSEMARFVGQFEIKSTNVLCHIRKANRGRVCLENTHPFSRELWGQTWTFAHNGQLKGIKRFSLSFYRPVGTTDSEHAFCWLLGEIRQAFPRKPKGKVRLRRFIEARCRVIAERGIFNMLMCDAEELYTYCSTDLSWLTRKAPFGHASLIDRDMVVDFAQVTTHNDVVTVIATKPLTSNEQWVVMERGEYAVFQDGVVQYRGAPVKASSSRPMSV